MDSNLFSGIYFVFVRRVALPAVFLGLFWSNVAAPAVLKRMQTGTITLTNVLTGRGTIAAVDPTKSFVVATGAVNTANPRTSLYTAQLTDGTTVTATRSLSNATAFNIRYYVLEFSSGVSVQRGLGTLVTTNNNITLSSVGTLANAFVIMTYRNNANGAFSTDDFTRSDLTSTTNLAVQSRGTSATGVFEYQVVTHLNAAVQRGTVEFGTTTASVTAPVSGIDPSRAWLYHNCDSDAGVTARIGQKAVLGIPTDSSTLTFSRDVTGQAMTCNWQVIEFNDNTRVQHGTLVLAQGTGSGTVTLGAPAIVNSTLPIGGWNNSCGRSNFQSTDNVGPLFGNFVLTSPTSLVITRPNTGSLAVIPWRTISFPKRKINFTD